jgi:3'-phosphoadenosine 5'-phosphosulfate sulfotransferase (PAPS reductase)/FAD synthetase
MTDIIYSDLINMSLKDKIEYSNIRIKHYLKVFNNKCYVAFSGGKDSTVLLDIVRKINPDVKGVFVNTGLEYPDIVKFVKSIDNVEIVYPKKSFKEVLDKYGYPVVSKEVSKNISRYRNTKLESQKIYRLTGIKKDGSKGYVGVIPKKWQFLINAPFKISDRCCDILKKEPLIRYEKESNYKPLIGVMSTDSHKRKLDYLRYGCTFYKGKHIKCMPLSIWKSIDIWEYIRENKIFYCPIYNKGESRTGCIYCLFGLQYDLDRFNRMAVNYPILYNYCMKNLGLKNVIDFLNLEF